MAEIITYEWIARGQCEACASLKPLDPYKGVIWTIPNRGINIVCLCGGARIENNILVSGIDVDDALFANVVAFEMGTSIDNLNIKHVIE